MNASSKILLGAAGVGILALLLAGPLGLGKKCAGKVAAPVVAPVLPVVATAEQVQSCQAKVNAAIEGKHINFSSGGSAIVAESMPLVTDIGKMVKDCAGTVVEVAGHTDYQGDEASNQTLSEQRARAVVAALVADGVPADRLTAKGYGEAAPLDPSRTAEAMAKNRRIEFAVAATAAAQN